MGCEYRSETTFAGSKLGHCEIETRPLRVDTGQHPSSLENTSGTSPGLFRDFPFITLLFVSLMFTI
jgi:hypothetical protein